MGMQQWVNWSIAQPLPPLISVEKCPICVLANPLPTLALWLLSTVARPTPCPLTVKELPSLTFG